MSGQTCAGNVDKSFLALLVEVLGVLADVVCVCTHACTKNESLICLQSRNVDFTPLLARSAFVPYPFLGRKKVR